jgi:hypothetical protein
MIISIINLSEGMVSDAQLQRVIRAVNRQIAEDFEPYWSFGAKLRLEGKRGKGRSTVELADMRGDAILYLRNKADVVDAEGYHDRHFSGIPYGFVFLALCKKLREPWSITLSHEALELIGDPENNLFVQGPHPSIASRKVFHWFEMCDAVQNEHYTIDDVQVSNFVLPLYFTSSSERGGRNDFLGSETRRGALKSFSTNPGGYIGFYDPTAKDDDTWSSPKDRRAAQRLSIKSKAGSGRGYRRGRRQSE